MSEEMRWCAWCGKTKPLNQFPVWLLNKPVTQTCLQCRDWEDSLPPLDELVEQYQKHKTEWEQKGYEWHQQQRHQEWKRVEAQARLPVTSFREKRYLKRLRE